MIGELLTGLSENEVVAITLEADTSEIKTVFYIQNVPAAVELEIKRIGLLFEAAGLPAYEGGNYGWLAFGLVKAENWNVPGEVFEFPKTEKIKTKDGKQVKRISVEWLISKFGHTAATDIKNELVNAIYTYNTLKPGERKNWTWPLKSTISEDKTDSPVSAPKSSGDTTKEIKNAENSVTSESTSDDGQKSPL